LGLVRLNILIRVVLGLRIHDNLSGYLAFRRSLVEDLDRDAIFHGYGDYAIRNVCGLRLGPPSPCVLGLVGSRPGV